MCLNDSGGALQLDGIYGANPIQRINEPQRSRERRAPFASGRDCHTRPRRQRAILIFLVDARKGRSDLLLAKTGNNVM